MNVQIAESWKGLLADEFNQLYFQGIVDFLKAERAAGKTIYPSGPQIFAAFAHTPVEAVKVVILGQDPYHGPGQAHGLSFSVPDGVPTPPSLVNIFKELHEDVGITMPRTGNLTPWADQGVLLLNAALTVEARQANSHAKIGWHRFTDAVIRAISLHKDNVVFMLWGAFAQGKESLIDASRHLVLKSAHPSPLSATRWFGNRHFSKCNAYLRAHGMKEIDWQV